MTDAIERLRSALERLDHNFDLLLAGKPVRDVAETKAETNAVLAMQSQVPNGEAVERDEGTGCPPHCCCCDHYEPCCDCGEIMPSKACIGEKCWCGAAASKKVGEEILFDDPNPARHNLTRYICARHYAQLMGPLGAKQVGLDLKAPATPEVEL